MKSRIWNACSSRCRNELRCFPGAVDRAEHLWVYRGLVICYDADAGLTHQPVHRDGALISCVVPLSASSEYEGGGTYVEPLERAFALEQGCALLHPSAIRHAGHRITSGQRWVLVLFLNGLELSEGDHGRRFHARAREKQPTKVTREFFGLSAYPFSNAERGVS